MTDRPTTIADAVDDVTDALANLMLLVDGSEVQFFGHVKAAEQSARAHYAAERPREAEYAEEVDTGVRAHHRRPRFASVSCDAGSLALHLDIDTGGLQGYAHGPRGGERGQFHLRPTDVERVREWCSRETEDRRVGDLWRTQVPPHEEQRTVVTVGMRWTANLRPAQWVELRRALEWWCACVEAEAEWWEGKRETCPRCFTDDCGTHGETPERTDADIADHAACYRCGWTSTRSAEAANAEARADLDAMDRASVVDGSLPPERRAAVRKIVEEAIAERPS